MLAPLGLALDDRIGGHMSNTNRRVILLNILPPLPSRSKGVDAEIGGIDVDHDIVAYLGRNKNRCERSVPSLVGIEGRDSDQAMDPALRLEKSIGVIPIDRYRCTLDPGFITR